MTAHAPPRQAIVPRATYRVQLHNAFRFNDALALVPYLADLGISHLYISPPLRARAGSQHGYDLVDHGMLNPELGTRAEFDQLVAGLHAAGMGLLVDIVPNHMGVLSGDNAWWLDVLENGAASAHADHFDIEWRNADPVLANQVLLPILGDQYGAVLERGEIRLVFDAAGGGFALTYFEHRLPLDPKAYGALLRLAQRHLPTREMSSARFNALSSLAAQFDRLPPHDEADASARQRRQRDKTLLKLALAKQVRELPALEAAIAQVLAGMNGRPGERSSFDALDILIGAQAYRLAHWRIAADEINYRRFFDINELAALRMERADVFEATHRLLLELAASGAIDGLRVDHPDGMADPAGYFERLQLRYADMAGLPAPAVQPDGRLANLPLYVVIEKIVAPHEAVPPDWAVHGTTGYRFANVINGLLIDSAAKARLDRAWRSFVGEEAEDFDTLAWQCRHVVMDGTLAAELTVLSASLLRLAREDRRTRDFTLNSLRQALAEVVASFPVYRTYMLEKPSAQDRKFIDWAIGRARRRSLAADVGVFDFLRRVLIGRPLSGSPAGLGERYRVFARRLQQYTAPVAAKGIEDTALYRHHRLVSVNDVGGEPDAFGMSVEAFHQASLDRSIHWPDTMLATSTHDAKRSEDVRLRIDVISEMPALWRLTSRRWSRLNRSHKRTVDGKRAPTRNDEYLLYQLLVGSLPREMHDEAELGAYALRIEQAMLKSARESKSVTSWMNPNAAYEGALSSFVHALLGHRDRNLFLEDLQSTAAVAAWHGALNGLTMAVVKTLSPGVPDFYQGHEAIQLSLVDPDNRRAIDFDERRAMLAEARVVAALPDRSAALKAVLAQAPDGRAKFWVTWQALQLRQRHADMLREAAYVPLEVRGERRAHVIAFARRHGQAWVVVVGTRLSAAFGLPVGVAPVGDVWGDTEILWPQGAAPDTADRWLVDAVSGRRHGPLGATLPLAEVLREFPVAALFSADTGTHDPRA
ncbi:malto-oligosyltrehalose synthase [Hydrogenophaga sp.]|uniref:malto-oligosyltrehalose synthase n=1 Tax=Hydrogenophaga sp. TaxID=1904254 RepID=UPI003F6FED56